jgi:cytochrome c oxidase subunit IV
MNEVYTWSQSNFILLRVVIIIILILILFIINAKHLTKYVKYIIIIWFYLLFLAAVLTTNIDKILNWDVYSIIYTIFIPPIFTFIWYKISSRMIKNKF